VDGDRDFSDNTAKSKIFTSLSTDFTYPVVKVRPQGATELRSDPDLPAVRWSVASSDEDTEQWTDVEWSGAAQAEMVETRRLELLTLSLQRRCSAN
jgi:hypothetical protein